MKNRAKFNEIEAMVPVYVKGKGNCTKIIETGAYYIQNATIETCIKWLADYYNISLYHNRINYGNELGIINKVPIAINENLVFIYVNVREPMFKHDAASGIIALSAIKEVVENDGFASILLNCGVWIQTRQNAKNLKKVMLMGRLVKDMYKEKHKK